PRARPQADSDDRGKPPLPSARAGKLLRLGCMRVPPRGRLFVVCVMVVVSVALAMMMMMAMVVIVAMIVVVMRATMVRVTMVRVIMMRVIMMRVIVMRVIVIARRHRGADGGGTVERMQQRQERTPLHPQQSRADDDDERIANDFDHVDGAAHGRRGRVQERGRQPHH